MSCASTLKSFTGRKGTTDEKNSERHGLRSGRRRDPFDVFLLPKGGSGDRSDGPGTARSRDESRTHDDGRVPAGPGPEGFRQAGGRRLQVEFQRRSGHPGPVLDRDGLRDSERLSLLPHGLSHKNRPRQRVSVGRGPGSLQFPDARAEPHPVEKRDLSGQHRRPPQSRGRASSGVRRHGLRPRRQLAAGLSAGPGRRQHGLDEHGRPGRRVRPVPGPRPESSFPV